MVIQDAHIPLVVDILLATIPPDERFEFKSWADEVAKRDFWRVLPSFFSSDEVKAAIADYVIDQLKQLEHTCGVSVHSVIKVDGRTYVHGSFNEEYGC